MARLSQVGDRMRSEIPTIGLVELANGRINTVEAVTIVREIANRITDGTIPGVPSPQVIRLSPSGSIAVEGPIAADARTVTHAAYLLETLLPDPDVRSTDHVPGALRLIVARALGTLDLPPYLSLEAFADALARFAAPDAAACIQSLVLRAADRTTPEPLSMSVNAGGSDAITISDIRRARRSTGLTLTDIAGRTGIPAALLCELEWGYLNHWPEPGAARRWLLQYARTTGIDAQLVLRTAWPILEEQIRDRERRLNDDSIVEAVPVDNPEETAPPVELCALVARYPPASTRKPRRLAFAVAALAIPALLLIGVAPAARGYLSMRREAAPHVSTATGNRGDTSLVQEPARSMPAQRSSEGSDAGGGVQHVAVSDASTDPTGFSSVGSATFYRVKPGDQSRGARDAGSLLRITSVVEDRAHNFHARPSPDGRLVAFDSDRDGSRGVYVANTDGQQVRRVSGEGFAAIPSWSPDGHTLAFVRAEPDRPQVWNLWTINLTTGQSRRLTSYPVGQPSGGSWFPDGRRIAFGHDDQLVVMNVMTGATRVYPSSRKGVSVRNPAVSPDGSRAVLQAPRDGTWLLEFRTGAMKKILADPSAEEYTWAPDGRRVAYHSRATDAWGVWILPPAAAK